MFGWLKEKGFTLPGHKVKPGNICLKCHSPDTIYDTDLFPGRGWGKSRVSQKCLNCGHRTESKEV